MPRNYAHFLPRIQLVAGLVAGLLALSPGRARAYEDQLSVDVAAGYGLVTGAPTLSHAGAFDVGVSYGLGPTWAVRGAVGAQAWSAPQGRVRPVVRALAELTYSLDVLSFVPSFGVGGSAWLISRAQGKPSSETAVVGGAHLVLGLDYLVSRAFNVGLDLRQHLLFPLGGPSFGSEIKLRASWLFELF